MAPRLRPGSRPPGTGQETGAGDGGLRRWTDKHGLLAYTLSAYGIFWILLIGGFFGTGADVLDAEGALVGVMNQAAAAGPLIAVVVVLAVSQCRHGLAGLAWSIVRWRVHPLWYVFVFLAVPLLGLAGIWALYPGATSAALGQNPSLLYTQLPLGILSIALVTGLAEEPGWPGYAQPAANRRNPPLIAALAVSVIWALSHFPNALFVQNPTETLSHLVGTVVHGFVLAWVYNSTGGSVLLVMLLHGAH